MFFKSIGSRLLDVCKVTNAHFRFLSSSNSYVQHFVKVHGIEINYVKAGKEISEDNLILLPGALGSAWTDFKPQIEKLPQLLPNYTIIAWDPPGYGKFRPTRRQFGLDMFEKDALYAIDLLKELEINRFDILGWSDGGITGMVLAGHHPKNVNKLVIWGANAFIYPEELKIYEGIRDVNKWSDRMREPMEAVYGKHDFAVLWEEWVDLFKRFAQEKDGDICKEVLQDIIAPTLIVHGAKDPMISPQHIPFLQNHIKNTELFVFDEGKHNIHLKYPDQFNKVVAEFLLKNKTF